MEKRDIANKIILIDKPKSITSFDVIRILRKQSGIKKMGHSGTLDPNATGLMIVGVGKATKELTKLIGLPKVYEAEILLGKKTDSGDITGKTLKEELVKTIDDKKLKKILKEMVGDLKLPIPIYSAKKISGRPLYKYAREGLEIEPQEKIMKIYWIELKDHFAEENHYIIRLELKVKSGTYIRSIAEEIGKKLGFPATLKELRRTKIGEFNLKDAKLLKKEVD